MRLFDWTILGIYCALILGLALYFQKRASGGVVEFFAAGRDLPWWVIGFADVAGYTGGGQGFVMLLFLSGYSGLWLMAWLSWIIWMPLVAIIWAPMWRRLNVVTTGEFIERRYAGRVARNYRTVYALYACVAWGMTSVAYAAAWMTATASPVLGWSPMKVMLVFGGVTIVYTLLAGLFAVAYNDVLQFLLLMGGNLAFGILLMQHAGGMHAVWQRVAAVRGEQFLSSMPSGSGLSAMTIVALCIQGLFFAGSPFAGEGWTAQRFMAARDERHAVLGQMSNGVLALVVRLIPFILIALAAAALYTPSQVAVPATLWGDLVRRYAPPGLLGLLLVSSLAGYMAAISSIGNWAASYLVNDIYARRINPSASQKQLISASRLATGGLLCIAFVLGMAIRIDQLDKWILFINSSLIVFSLPLAWLKWFWWRTNAWADMVGVLGGFPAGYIVWFGSDAVLPASLRAMLSRVTHFNWNGLIPAFSDLQRFPFWMGFGVLFITGWVVIVAVALLTKPEPKEILADFYRLAKPIGFWKPVQDTLPMHERPTAKKEVATAIFGMLFYFLLTAALFEGMGGHALRCLLAASCAAIAGIMFYKSSMRIVRRTDGANISTTN
ncbi:MAG: hypothetical protein JSS87_07105 [Acidobacteria bacterium]|nr:hypothetical protein [Acidobacteriota bacterium]